MTAATDRDRAWQGAASAIALTVLVPLLALGWSAARGSEGLWTHVAVFVLPRATLNTLLLLAGVGLTVAVLGTGTAWLVTAYDFPGRRILSWALLLPLAVPTYIVAYAYLDLLHPLGPVQSGVRAILGVASPRDLRLPDVRSLAGCVLLLGFVLYPYVYLSTRAMFLSQAAGLLEAARTLGVPRASLFHRIALPLARPAVGVGLALALLETLNDIGASQFLGVQTLTVSVYTTWITRSDLAGAAQIALAMLLLVVGLITLERRSRRRQRYAAAQRPRPMRPVRLRGRQGWAAFAACLAPVAVGFLVPAAYLAVESGKRMERAGGVSAPLVASTGNTLLVALAATAATVVAGLVVAWAVRLARARRRPRLAEINLRVASLGYAIPGTVLAIGLLVPLALFDTAAGEVLRWTGGAPRMVLMGSTTALVIAYTARFLAIAAGSAEAGLERIPTSLDEAARSLGRTPGQALWRVHLPLLRPAMAAGALLVFVDAMKELPVTLLLRPMNFETLATWLYADAVRGAYEDGAVAALIIVLVGLLPVVALARTGSPPGADRGTRP